MKLDLPFASVKFLLAWGNFVKYRADAEEKANALTKRSANMTLKRLEAMGHDDAIEAIERSIAGSWSGVFPPGADRRSGDGPSKVKPDSGKYDAWM